MSNQFVSTPLIKRTAQMALRAILIGLFIATAAVVVWGATVVQAQQSQWQGLIEVMPAGGLIGQWTVQGRAFTTDANTDFRQDKGAFAVGVCAEVEYVGAASPFLATKIASKNADDCLAGTSTASTSTPSTSTPSTSTPETSTPATATPSPDTTGTPGVDQEAFGRVESLPAPGFVGAWTISGVTYNAPASAEFKQENGPLVIGACVKVHYFTNTSPFTLRELSTELASACNGATPTATVTGTPNATPSGTPVATSTAVGEIEIYGRLDSLPSGLIGTWTVSAVAYTATAGTEFKQEHGAFTVGGCVKLHASTTTTPATIREIETEHEFRCSGGGSNAEGELFGLLQSFPAGLIGGWNIGGLTFVADANTEFKQANGAFAVGMTVKVHFVRDSNGINLARELETKFANDDNGSDDDGNGSFEGAEGHAYGVIDSFPANQQGVWLISGVAYTTTAATVFSQTDGNFVVGAKVKVEYFLDASGVRMARKIETTNSTGGATAPNHFKLFGFVNGMPPSGFVGTWVIDNIAFVADANTQFKENNGLLALGSYVAVEYFIQDGRNQMHEIETHVPPGAGTLTTVGQIDDKGVDPIAASVSAATWIIGGVSYTVTPATDLNDILGELAVGKTALVNSYTDLNGSQVATQIRGINLSTQLYLPVVVR